MKKFKFEIELNEDDLKGDEFWEEALANDGTGITVLKQAIAQAIEDSNLMISSDRSAIDVITLKSFEDT